MPREQINYGALNETLTKKATYRLSDVKDQIEVLGFDIVRFKSDDNDANLWKIDPSPDGDYIVSTYEEAPDTLKTASQWEIVLNKTASAMQVYYKQDPIVQIKTASLGIPAEELSSLPRYLPHTLASNKSLVHSLLKELSESAKNAVLSKYPELI